LKFSLSTATLYFYPLRLVFRWAQWAGFDGVELVVNPEAIVRGGQAVRRLAEVEGVEIVSVHPTVVPLPGWWERRGGLEPTLCLALEAGAGLVVLHTPRVESLEEGEGLAFRRRIERWQTRLAGTGLRLAIENKAIRSEADRRYALSPLHRLRAFADRYELGLVLDTTHAGSAGQDLLQALQIFDGRLANVHLSDMGGRLPLANVLAVRTLLGEHRFPESGDLPLAALLGSLGRDGYAGPVTLEVNPWAAHAWWPPALRRRLNQAANWMRRVSASAKPDPEG
jgi:sugar phosphate isomerase/epimerase